MGRQVSRRAYGSGSVSQRKDGRFQAQAMYEGHRITKYGKTAKEAYANLQEMLDKLKQGKMVFGSKQTVEQYLTHWLENEHRLEVEPQDTSSISVDFSCSPYPEFGICGWIRCPVSRYRRFVWSCSMKDSLLATLRKLYTVFCCVAECGR